MKTILKILGRYLYKISHFITKIELLLAKSDYSITQIIKSLYLSLLKVDIFSIKTLKHLLSFITLWRLFVIFRAFVSLFYAILGVFLIFLLGDFNFDLAIILAYFPFVNIESFLIRILKYFQDLLSRLNNGLDIKIKSKIPTKVVEEPEITVEELYPHSTSIIPKEVEDFDTIEEVKEISNKFTYLYIFIALCVLGGTIYYNWDTISHFFKGSGDNPDAPPTSWLESSDLPTTEYPQLEQGSSSNTPTFEEYKAWRISNKGEAFNPFNLSHNIPIQTSIQTNNIEIQTPSKEVSPILSSIDPNIFEPTVGAIIVGATAAGGLGVLTTGIAGSVVKGLNNAREESELKRRFERQRLERLEESSKTDSSDNHGGVRSSTFTANSPLESGEMNNPLLDILDNIILYHIIELLFIFVIINFILNIILKNKIGLFLKKYIPSNYIKIHNFINKVINTSGKIDFIFVLGLLIFYLFIKLIGIYIIIKFKINIDDLIFLYNNINKSSLIFSCGFYTTNRGVKYNIHKRYKHIINKQNIDKISKYLRKNKNNPALQEGGKKEEFIELPTTTSST